jgi:hypothetical protein
MVLGAVAPVPEGVAMVGCLGGSPGAVDCFPLGLDGAGGGAGFWTDAGFCGVVGSSPAKVCRGRSGVRVAVAWASESVAESSSPSSRADTWASSVSSVLGRGLNVTGALLKYTQLLLVRLQRTFLFL